MLDSQIYLQISDIAQCDCSSSTFANLFLYHYECNYKNNSLQQCRYIDVIILISIENANCSLPIKYLAYLTLTCNNFNNNVTIFSD